MISSLVLSQMPRRGFMLSAGFNVGVKEPFFLIIFCKSPPAPTLSAAGLDAPNLHV